MRSELKERSGERTVFRGTFEKFGQKRGWRRPVTTVLLVNILDSDGNPISDHLWFNLTKGFAALNLQQGDIVEFQGRVVPYVKGYFGWRDDVYRPISTDYKLSRPTRIRKAGKHGKILEEQR